MSINRAGQGVVAALVLLASIASGAEGQERRRSSGGAPPPPPAGTIMDRRFPLAGVWEGKRMGLDREAHPATMLFTVSDSAKQVYVGAQLMADGGRVPFPDAAWAEGQLKWKSPNSGGGDWLFTGRLTGTDTLRVEAVLKGAPWNPSPEPVMTYVLTRKAPGR